MSLTSLPKAELHLHIEGTMEPELVFELAARNHVTLQFADVEDLRDRYVFADLQSFLNLYYAAMDVLRTADDFTDLARAYLDRAYDQGVRHVEMFFDPQPHMDRGVPIEAVIDGLRAALDEVEQADRMSGGLILCFLRDRGPDEATAVLAAASSRLGSLLGVGLDSAEVGYPPGAFRDAYAQARDLGLHTVAHAGEEGPPAYVWEALDVLGVERIDHGIRSMEDPELVARLRRDRIPLTVCPLSNVRLGAVERLDLHPLARMLDEGLMVTVNSDDPAYFGGYVSDNYEACARELDLDHNQLSLLAQNSVNASFAPAERKATLLAEIDAWAEPAAAQPQRPAGAAPALRLLLIGPPGSGKGTQGKRLAERYSVEHIAAGDLLRHEVEAQSDIGRRASDAMKRGELVPDDLVFELVMPKVIAAGKANGYVLDGFPRSVSQAEEGRPIAEENGVAVTMAVRLDAIPDELMPRLLARAQSEGRIDDTPDVIRARLEVFNEEVEPLLDFYRARGLLVTIDASGSPDDVWAQLQAAVESS